MAERGEAAKAVLMTECKSKGNQSPILLHLANVFIQFYVPFIVHIAMHPLQRLGVLNRVLEERKAPLLKPKIFALFVLERLFYDILGERKGWSSCSLLKQLLNVDLKSVHRRVLREGVLFRLYRIQSKTIFFFMKKISLFFHEISHLNIYLGLQLNSVRQIYGFSQETKSRY